MLIPGGEPFLFPGNKTGCLLVHGFTGTPAEMKPLGKYLAAQGFTVLGIRLFAHSTQIEDMNRSRWQDWAACVEDGWYLLQEMTDQVFLIGLSMGGVLSLLSAPKFPFAGVAALSTPLQLELETGLNNLEKLLQEISFVEKGESDWHDPQASIGQISYDHYPIRGIIELYQLLKEMQTRLPLIKIPTLLIHSKNDTVVDPKNMPTIYQLLGTSEEEKTMVWVENSGHVVTRDSEKEQVFSAIRAFISRVSSQP